MINPRLATVTKALDDWCRSQNIPYDIVCDESDLQGVMLFKKDTVLLAGLLNTLAPVVQEQGVFAQLRKVRGGNILAFSVRAISESTMSRMISDAGEREEPLTFAERVEQAFTITPPITPVEPEPLDLYTSAQRIAEAQFKSATAGNFRNNQDGRQRQSFTRNTSFGGAEHPASPRGRTKKQEPKKSQVVDSTTGPTTKPPTRFESRREFYKSLQEALDGIATPTGAQPQDLFSKFSRALKVLGDQLGIGPLQDRLKEQGIKWKKSDDGQSIILFIVNATTKAPQPIARVSAEVLDNPSDFEEQLTHMLDFAQGDAPGAFKQKQDQIKNQERAVRDIAKAVSPQDQEGEVAKQMNAGLTPEQQSAQVAASPKPATGAAPQPAPQSARPTARPTAQPTTKPTMAGRF